jgi:aminoglycoside phosphotransferase (APT) family kinase protein
MAAEGDLALDAAGVRAAAEEALSALKEAQKIRNSLTGASNSVHSARETLDLMVSRVEASLSKVETLIAAA